MSTIYRIKENNFSFPKISKFNGDLSINGDRFPAKYNMAET
jgi:hypothetical protein